MKTDEAIEAIKIAISIAEDEAFWQTANRLRDVIALLKQQDAQIKSLMQTAQNMMEGLVVFRG